MRGDAVSEIQVRENVAPVLAPVEVPARLEPNDPGFLAQWVESARQVELIARNLASTSFVPQTLRGKPEETAAAILAGLELGLPPMAALRSMDVIQGTPALRAHAMRGLVQSRGHSVELVESSPERCVMRGRRRGEDAWQEVTWTLARAEKMGLLGKNEWKKQPGTMLVARATGEICRLIAADALYAMPYASEELAGADSSDVVRVARPMVSLDDIIGPSAPRAVEPGPAAEWAAVQYQPREEHPAGPSSDDDLHLWTEEQIQEQFPGAYREGPELIVPRKPVGEEWPPVRQPGGE